MTRVGKGLLGKWNKIFIVAVATLFLAVIAIGIYLVVSKGGDDATQQQGEVKIVPACNDENVRAAVRAFDGGDNAKLYEIVSAVQGDVQFQTNARCVYMAVLYSIATKDRASADHYLAIYESLPVNARLTLEEIEGVKKVDALKSLIENLAAAGPMPGLTPGTQIDPNSDTSTSMNTIVSSGAIGDAADERAAAGGYGQ